MGKKKSKDADDLSGVFKSLFAADNPFRRAPPPHPDHSQKHLAGGGNPRDVKSPNGDESPSEKQKKRKRENGPKPNPSSDLESAGTVSEMLKKRNIITENGGGDVADGSAKKRRKKRKRDEVEEKYERRKYGDSGEMDLEEGKLEEKEVPSVAVGEKRKAMDDANEMVTPRESFDDESKLLRTVFVGNLPLKMKRKALLKEFGSFGEVESVRIRSVPLLDSKIPRKGAVIKGKVNDAVNSIHAYVVFKEEQSAQGALAHNMAKVGGNHIRVDMACPPRKKIRAEAPLYNIKRTVFVGNLPFDVKDEEIYQLFCEANQLESSVEGIRVVRDPHTSMGKGIAYVLFKTRDAANTLVRRKDLKLRDRDLRLSHARSDSTPTKRKSLGPKRADFPNKRSAAASDGDYTPKVAAKSLSYQGLRASKSGVVKKAPRAAKGNEKFEPKKSGSAEQDRKTKRPAVADRKAKFAQQSGKKRKQETETPENSRRYKKPRRSS